MQGSVNRFGAVWPLVQVAFALPLLAGLVLFDGQAALAQSAVTLGSTLDPTPSNDSLLPVGSLRIDGPSDSAPGEATDESKDGTDSIRLQLHGSTSGFGLGFTPLGSDPTPPSLLGGPTIAP